MVPSARVVSFAAVLLALTVGARASRAGDDAGTDPPDAARVVLRGKTELGDALRAAIRARGATPASVAIVVDVTPYVSVAEDRIAQAVLQVAKGLPDATSWRAGALGRRLSAAAASADGASLRVAEAMLTRTTVTNTVAALRESLADFTDRDAVVVYLADWRFEDDDGTEALVAALRTRGQTLSVVGSEAAFSRAWNDGLDWNSAVQSVGLVGDPRIGRNPFGPRDAEAPWHGGDAAWPGHPGYWNGAPWVSDFMPRGGARAGAIEDLRERLADQAAGAQASRPHALPSSFGPWGLMRAAGATGGRYVLWSWNPRGRSDVTYDWSRCDLFAPDLRARDTIRADLARRPIAHAIVRAWEIAADPKFGVASVSSPLSPRFAAQEMHRIAGGDGMRTSWGTRDQHRAFLRAAPEALARMDDAIDVLGRAVRDADRRLDDPDRRLLADAHLFRHVLVAERHSIGEALEEAKTVPDAWFDEKEMWVGLQPTLWVEAGADPERIDARFDLLRDRARGQAAVDDRAAMLRRYAATPFGETVARNQMYVWRAKLFPLGNAKGDATRSPAESTPTPPLPTPGGSAGAPGPSTGK